MIQTVFSAELPVGERLLVRKNHLTGAYRDGPRIAVVTGMHGDELEGQYVAFELARRLGERPGSVHGTVDIYPALNPLGLSTREHGVPQFDIDLDRTFPGNDQGDLTEALAAAIIEDVSGATVCLDVHAANISLCEVSQVRVEERDASRLVQLASLLNASLVWARVPQAAMGSSLAHTLNERGTPTLVVEIGTGMRVTRSCGDWLVEGILRLMEHLGAWDGPTVQLPYPQVTNGGNVRTILCDDPGLFLPHAEHGSHVRTGDLIGIIADSLEGRVIDEVRAPCDGTLFTLRIYPVVYPGSLVARILEGGR